MSVRLGTGVQMSPIEPERPFVGRCISSMFEGMTNLLKNAFKLAQRLPDTDQDALAALIIDEMASDRRWQEAFDGSADALDRLADEALAEYRAGETLPLDPDKM